MALVEPLMPSDVGVVKTPRKSADVVTRTVVTYVPELGPKAIGPTVDHVVDPTARRWRSTVRCDTTFPLSRRYAVSGSTVRRAVRVAEPPKSTPVALADSPRSESRSRQVENFAAD